MAALIFILQALFNLVIWAFLLRVLLPLCRADARNPLSQGIIRFTNPVVMPLRRVLPAFGRVDGGSLVALLLVQLVSTAVVLLLRGIHPSLLVLTLSAARTLLDTLLQFYFFALLIYALLSWVAPGTYSPASNILQSLCTPVLRPFQRLIPPLGGLDLSVVFAMIAIQALRILLNS